MTFALNLFFSLICSYCFSKFYCIKQEQIVPLYIAFLFPVWIMWLIICGGQYYVGTDYEAYYSIFKDLDLYIYYYKNEYLFAWIVELSAYLGFPPQAPFFFFYLIGIFFFVLILTKLHHKTSFFFLLLYITVSTVFNNQLNGLRQYIAIYICTYAVLNLYGKAGSVKFVLYLLLASLIHSSSIFVLPFLIFRFKPKISYRQSFILLLTSLIFSLLGSFNWIISSLDFIIPSHYQHYLGGTFDVSNSFIKIITKLIYIPFYLYSMILLKKNRLNGFDLFLYKVGIISYSLRILFIDNFILNRIGNLFILLSILPLYYLLRDLYLRKETHILWFIILFVISFYLLKVLVFPKQEYLYNSIYWM